MGNLKHSLEVQGDNIDSTDNGISPALQKRKAKTHYSTPIHDAIGGETCLASIIRIHKQ